MVNEIASGKRIWPTFSSRSLDYAHDRYSKMRPVKSPLPTVLLLLLVGQRLVQ